MTRVSVVLVVDSSVGSEAVPGSSTAVSTDGSVEGGVSLSSVADGVVEVVGSRGSGVVGPGLGCSDVVWVGDVVVGVDVVVG